MQDGQSQTGTFSIAADAAAAVRTRWAGGAGASPPSIAEILTPTALADDDILTETLTADAEERQRRGLDARLETYIAAAPQVGRRSSACRALLMVEVAARTSETDEAIRADLAARLPGMADDIDTVMSLASLFRGAAADATVTRAPGCRLGKYVLRSRLGEGSFGEVWQAWDAELERYVALKILRTAHQLGTRGTHRFLAEVRAAAALDHECVVRVHGAGQFAETGEYYIDTQLVGEPLGAGDDPQGVEPGRTLEHRLEKGPVPPLEAAAIMAAAARGVAAAHARGITHRDLKPSNILVTAGGRPLVADFGLSVSGFNKRASRIQSVDPGPRVEAPPVAGTPAYMSPEQARGEHATPLSDIYSLGATLRALLTGRPPYEPLAGDKGSARRQVLAMVADGRLAPLLEASPALPRALAAICDRACAADPRQRYASAEQLSADLQAFLAHRPTLADPPGTVRRTLLMCRRHALTSIISAAAFLVVVAATLAFIYGLTLERDRAVAAQAEAATQRDAAVNARDAVETMNQFLARTFNSTRGQEQRADFSVIDAIELASRRAGRTFVDRPLVEAGVRHFLGQGAMGAGHVNTARRELQRAWELRRDQLGANNCETLATRRQLAELLVHERRYKEADVEFRAILQALRDLGGEESQDGLAALTYLGNQKRVGGDATGAVEMLERAVAGYRRVKQYGSTDYQRALNWLVLAYVDVKQLDRAEAAQREIIRMNETDLGPDDISTLNATQALGWVLRLQHRYDDAKALYRDVLARYKATVGLSHGYTVYVGTELALLLMDQDPEESIRLARDAVAGSDALPEARLGGERAMIVLARALIKTGKEAEAEGCLKRAIEAPVGRRTRDHNVPQEAASVLIELLERQQRHSEADAVRARAASIPAPTPTDR